MPSEGHIEEGSGSGWVVSTGPMAAELRAPVVHEGCCCRERSCSRVSGRCKLPMPGCGRSTLEAEAGGDVAQLTQAPQSLVHEGRAGAVSPHGACGGRGRAHSPLQA